MAVLYACGGVQDPSDVFKYIIFASLSCSLHFYLFLFMVALPMATKSIFDSECSSLPVAMAV